MKHPTIRIRRPPPAWLHLVPPRRQNEGHVSVRFKGDVPLCVFLNGEDVSKDCVEAQAGPGGWVMLVDRARSPKHLHHHKEYGDVRIEGYRDA